jgi:antitoxin HicB
MRTKLEYPVLIEPLSPEDGGGFLATVPDLQDDRRGDA